MKHRGTEKPGALAVTGILAVLALVYTWPLVTGGGAQMIGGDRDGPMFLWNLWWGAHAAFELGTSPLATDHLFAPLGTSLVINTHAVLPALLSAPLQALGGLIVAYNGVILLTFVLSGLGAYLLAREVLADRAAALVTAVAFAFAHYRVSFVMFLNLIQSQFLVLFAWALWRSIERRSLASAALAGLLAAANLYSSYNLAVLAALLGACLCARALVRALGAGPERRALLGFYARSWALVLGVAVLLCAPLLGELVEELLHHEYYVTLDGSKTYDESTPLLRYLVPGPLSGGGELQHWQIRQAAYLGVFVMGLAVLGLVRPRRGSSIWFWFGIAVLFLVTSLGPRLVWEGKEPVGDLPLPFHFLRELPVLREVRVAHRYGLVGCLALTVVAGFGARAVLEWSRRGARPAWLRATLPAILPAAVFLDAIQLPFPKLYRLPEAQPAFARIAEDPRDCLVFEFPAGRTGYKLFSYFETLHGKPVYLDGQVARRIPHLEEAQAGSRIRVWFEQAFDGVVPRRGLLELQREEVRREVAENRIGWIVLAWIDYRETMKKDLPLTRRRLEAMTTVAREGFDVEEVVFEADFDRALAWSELSSTDQKSANCILGVYKLR